MRLVTNKKKQKIQKLIVSIGNLSIRVKKAALLTCRLAKAYKVASNAPCAQQCTNKNQSIGVGDPSIWIGKVKQYFSLRDIP